MAQELAVARAGQIHFTLKKAGIQLHDPQSKHTEGMESSHGTPSSISSDPQHRASERTTKNEF